MRKSFLTRERAYKRILWKEDLIDGVNYSYLLREQGQGIETVKTSKNETKLWYLQLSCFQKLITDLKIFWRIAATFSTLELVAYGFPSCEFVFLKNFIVVVTVIQSSWKCVIARTRETAICYCAILLWWLYDFWWRKSKMGDN